MKLNKINILWIIGGMLTLLTACQETKLIDGNNSPALEVEEGIPGTLTLPVNISSMSSHIITRSTTAATDDEKHISTLYVFIINIQDKTTPASNPILSKRWFPDVSKLRDASGHIQVSIPTVSCNQVRIFAVANLNTPNQIANNNELLKQYNQASTEEQLKSVRAILDIETNQSWILTDRSQGNLLASGYFRKNTGTMSEYPLSAQEEIFTLAVNNGSLKLQNPSDGTLADGAVWLHRLDAKIKFEVKLAENLPAGAYFNLKAWQVINLHKQAYIHWQTQDASGTNTGSEYLGESDEMTGSYISELQNSEGKTTSEFTFYALENRHVPQTQLATPQEIISAMTLEGYTLTSFTNADQAYVLREKNIPKDGHKTFMYAPEAGTYVVLKGEFYTPSTLADGSQQMQRAANVKYLIHLGYIGQDNMEGTGSGNNEVDKLNDYSILRNSTYTYRITVKEVNNIRVEAEKKGDPQPSAEGSVIDSEFDLQADSHYEQRLIAFNLKEVAEKIKEASASFSYTVKTPFTAGEQTVTVQPSGDDNRPQNIDDQWIHFVYMGNNATGNMSMSTMELLEKSGGYGLPYAYTYTNRLEESHVTSNPFQLWPATTLLRNLQAWITMFNSASDKTVKGTGVRTYIKLDNGTRFYLTRFFTVYVDEYYYTQNPNTGTASNTLWTQFCNTADRTMRVFLNNYTSNDGWSSYSRSGLNVRQKAIQTAYATGETGQQLADQAYGIENTDEYGKNYNTNVAEAFNSVITDRKAGLKNTLNALYSPLTRQILGGNYTWEAFYNLFNFDARTSEGQSPADASHPERIQRYAHLAALTRNRDNNRNGIIDPEEVKWYIPSQEQMMNLYLGSFLMDEPLFEAKLLANGRACYLTSYTDASVLRFFIANEGTTFGTHASLGNAVNDSYIRCARSLGSPPVITTTPPYNSTIPEELATATLSSNNYTIIYNKYSIRGIRSYIERAALGSHTQHQSLARPYRSFIIARKMIYGKNADGTLDTSSGTLQVSWETANNICALYSETPEYSDLGKWRVPNLSEALSMLLYILPADMWNDKGLMWSCTRYSQTNGKYFGIDHAKGEIKHQTSATPGYVRCVHDIITQ